MSKLSFVLQSGAGATEVEATANSTHLSATLQKGSQRFEPRLVALIPLLVVGDSG